MESATINSGPLQTVDEAARQLSLSKSKVYELIARGELRSVRIGRSVRVLESEIKKFIEDHVVSPN